MKLNLILILSPILISFASCKKNYTCNCNTSYTFQNTSGGFTNIIIPANGTSYNEKMTEKKAKAACMHEQASIRTDFTNGITGNGQYSLVLGESVVTSCSIITK